MSAAELAIGARVDGLPPADVQAALWQERSLVKTWAMRGALHLIAASDLPLYVAARSLFDKVGAVGSITSSIMASPAAVPGLSRRRPRCWAASR